MMGRTHLKVGVFSYSLLLTAPVFSFIPYLNREITLIDLLIVSVAAILPDADSQHSLVNQYNIATKVATKGVEAIERLLSTITRIIFTIGLGTAMVFYASSISDKMFMVIDAPEVELIPYVLGITLILIGLVGMKGDVLIKKVPLLGQVYMLVQTVIKKIAAGIRKFLIVMIYVVSGGLVIYYNITQWQDLMVYLIGITIISVGISPHRTLLHAVEGVALMTFSFWYVSSKWGYEEAVVPFFIGYVSHLLLGDIFTEEGIPLSILPRLLKKLNMYRPLKRLKFCSLLLNILDTRLRVPIMSTGTTMGDVIEKLFVLLMGVVLLIIFVT